MKARRLAEILSVGAVSLAIWSTPSFAQTAVNVPKSIDDFNNIDGLDPDTDACANLVQTYGETLTYTQFLNKDYCAAKVDALIKEAQIEDDGLETAVTDAEGEKETAEADLAAARQAYADALAAKEAGDTELAELESAVVAAQAEADAKAAALAEAYERVAADFFASDSDAESVEDYIAANEDDENVAAYLAAQADFNEGRTAVTNAQAAVTTYEEGDYAGLLETLASTQTDLFGEDGSESAPSDDSVLGLYNAAVATYDDALADLTAANAELAALNTQADTALASNVAGTRNDDILASTGNPAKAVLETSDCLASGADDCNNDVGQAIVDGLDSLHQTDQALDTRLTSAEGDIVNLQGRMDTAEGDIEDLQEGLATETTERKAADAALKADINKEVADRKAADTVLQANIDKEVTDRKAADATLTTAISNEVSARAAADLVLDNKITTVNNRVTQLGERVDALTKESRQGIAMAMALAAIPTVNYGKFSLGLGVGTFASETAAALGMDFVVSERVKFKIGFTTTGDESGGSAGIAIGF
jgi:hypothetical protein